MHSGETSDYIPTDLILEILSRLPAKSIGRFRCVSKLWGSLPSRPYFSELFLTRSSARPRLLFAVQRAYNEWLLFSSPQPHYPYEKSLAADFHMTIFGGYNCCSYASGLIYLRNVRISKDDENTVSLICNPSTGQYAILPRSMDDGNPCCYLGFDPIGKQFKVLSVNYRGDDHRVLTLGTGELMWRKIQCPFSRNSLCVDGICINGVLYYLAQQTGASFRVIVCFDVRSEKFKFIDVKCLYSQLINYKGKLGGVNWDYGYKDRSYTLTMCILEDVEKQEWSKYVYTLPNIEPYNQGFSVVRMTATGEIVLSIKWKHLSDRFDVFYFNPERNTFQGVGIQGFGDSNRFCVSGDHVEDLKFYNIESSYFGQAMMSQTNQIHKIREQKSITPSTRSTSSLPLQNPFSILDDLCNDDMC